MSKIKFKTDHRMSEILELSQRKSYVVSSGFNFHIGLANVTRLVNMNPTLEELNYIRPSDGFCLLHFAVTSHNPYLVALLAIWGFNVDFESKAGITPRQLIEKTGHLVPGMKYAFSYPKQFLISQGLIEVEIKTESFVKEVELKACDSETDQDLTGDSIELISDF